MGQYMKSFYDMYRLLQETSGGTNEICNEVKNFIDKEYDALTDADKNLYYFCRDMQEKIIANFDIEQPVTNVLEELQFYSLLIAYVCAYLQHNELNADDCYKTRRGIFNIVFLYGNAIPNEEEVAKILQVSIHMYRNVIRISNGEKTLKLILNMRKLAHKHGFNHGVSWIELVKKLNTDRTSDNESVHDDFVIAMGLSGFGQFAKQYSDFSKSAKVGIDRPKNYTERMSKIFASQTEDEVQEDEDEDEDAEGKKYKEILARYIPNNFFNLQYVKLFGSFEALGPYNLNDKHPDYKSEDYTSELNRHREEYGKIVFGQNKFRDECFKSDLIILMLLVCKKNELVDDLKDLLSTVIAPPIEFMEKAVEIDDLPITEQHKKLIHFFFVDMREFVPTLVTKLFMIKIRRIITDKTNRPAKGSLEAKIFKLALSISRSREELISNQEKFNELVKNCFRSGLLSYNIILEFYKDINNPDFCNTLDRILSKEGIA